MQGAATLVIVMALFLIMGLLAAYANRSLLLEQRMATNHYQAAVAREMSEAAIDWTLAMLNAAALNDHCLPDAKTGRRLAQTYYTADAQTRRFVAAPNPAHLAYGNVDCARTDSGTWSCRCPAPGTLDDQPKLGTAATYQPSFAVSFLTHPNSRGGILWARMQSCTASSVQTCSRSGPANPTAEARSSPTSSASFSHELMFGLVSAVRSPPAAPLTVKGDITLQGPGLGLHNDDLRSGGIVLVAGGGCAECTPGALVEPRLESLPGTPVNMAMLTHDAALQDSSFDIARKYLGMTLARYAHHPAALTVECGPGDCASKLDAAAKAGHQMLVVNGDAQILGALSAGTAEQPVVMVVNGNLAISAPVQWVGLVATGGHMNWHSSGGASRVQGMVLSGGNFSTQGPLDIFYAAGVADVLRNGLGSFVKVPGSWRTL